MQNNPFRDLALGQYTRSFCIAHQLSNRLARIDVLSILVDILFETQLYDYFVCTTLSSGQNFEVPDKRGAEKKAQPSSH